ncbi:hypothetical protein SAMN06265365_107183 [Tistlia consotensis]|uniref:Uncharacterized protein n=1 Tax=Tistlia consotensis USBA 355 TaxID=560819 RepID=A0A1Y6BDP3_9PROT|nr:hypothetical protein [Tistlia consotensis]SME98580.1 hypothetical protein SAMN05428998_102185 [Tistlia consotensis USBA 355]SNR57969.1 hypothetical protein SAMN06265365_107183 [Tistlia consotensis]
MASLRQTAVRRAIRVASLTLNAIGIGPAVKRAVMREVTAAILKGNFSPATVQGWLAEQVDREVAEAAATGRPIVVGPWLMEVGFELLYWIPFLRAALARQGVPPERVVALSRGGVADWYGGLAGRYCEIFELIDRERFVAGNAEMERESQGKKPFEATAFERELVGLAAGRLGLERPAVLFPGLMYRMFRQAWNSRLGGEPILPYLDYRRIEGAFERPAALPFEGPYVAAKYYFSDAFPASERSAAFLRRHLLALAEQGPVVLLNTGLKLDDHADSISLEHPNLHEASGFWSAADNLAVQTALVANAERLYCTYGGFSYLGPLVGVSTEAVYEHPNFVGTHLDLALRALDFPDAGLAVAPLAALEPPSRLP